MTSTSTRNKLSNRLFESIFCFKLFQISNTRLKYDVPRWMDPTLAAKVSY